MFVTYCVYARKQSSGGAACALNLRAVSPARILSLALYPHCAVRCKESV